jgi:hypothetical protein
VLPLPLHTTSLRPSTLRKIFSHLNTLSTSSASIPPPDKPLIATIAALQQLIATKAGKGIENSENEDGYEVVEKNACDVPDTEMIYMAITTTDSTVVYYKLSKGIKKPADIPDE